MYNIPISGYADYLDMLPIEQLRQDARALDHDCHRDADGACRFCELVEGADKEKLLSIIEANAPREEIL